MLLPDDYHAAVRRAVRHFWATRTKQAKAQRLRGSADRGSRSSVTGGAQMDGFISMLKAWAIWAGVPGESIHTSERLDLPGYYRASKEWDLLIVHENRLLAAIETKSHVGPSFGNNFNNRTEQALGVAVDLHTAFREGAFRGSSPPWLGYLMLLEDTSASTRAVGVREPHFPVFPEFHGASYARRYELLCGRLVRERQYSAAALLLSDRASPSEVREPSDDLRFDRFVSAYLSHLRGQM